METFEYATSAGKVGVMEYIRVVGGCNLTSLKMALVKVVNNGEAIIYAGCR
jgi:hypothetical protein